MTPIRATSSDCCWKFAVKSDVDLFVVGGIDEDELHELVSRIEKDMGRVINYTLMSKAEFEKRLKNNNPFVKRVMDEKQLVLKGNNSVN